MKILFNLLLLNAFALSAQAASPDNIEKWCETLSKELRSVNKSHCLSHEWKTEAKSVDGRVIPHLEWAPKKQEKEKTKRVLILGAIHGDEISAVSTVFRWIEYLYHTKSETLKNNAYLFYPLVNPDGFYANPRTRTNKNGVDINRNFATEEWDEKAIQYWKSKTGSDPRRNPGKNAGGEVETKVVEKAIDTFKPDLIISVHAPYRLVDHDGPIDFPDTKSPLPVRALGAFPGSLGTFAGIERHIPVVTPELPNAKQLPDTKSLEQLFEFIMNSKY